MGKRYLVIDHLEEMTVDALQNTSTNEETFKTIVAVSFKITKNREKYCEKQNKVIFVDIPIEKMLIGIQYQHIQEVCFYLKSKKKKIDKIY